MVNHRFFIAKAIILLFFLGILNAQEGYLNDKSIKALKEDDRYGEVILSGIKNNDNSIFVEISFDKSEYNSLKKLEELCSDAGLILYKYELMRNFRLFGPNYSVVWAILTKADYLEEYNRYNKNKNSFFLYNPLKYMADSEIELLLSTRQYGLNILNSLMKTRNKNFFTKVTFENKYTDPQKVYKILRKAGLKVIKEDYSQHFRFGVTSNYLNWVLICTDERYSKYKKYVSMRKKEDKDFDVGKVFGTVLFAAAAKLTIDHVQDIMKSKGSDSPELNFKILKGNEYVNVSTYKYEKNTYRGPSISIIDGGSPLTTSNVCNDTYSVIYTDKYGGKFVLDDPFQDAIHDCEILIDNYPVTVKVIYENECESGEMKEVIVKIFDPGEYTLYLDKIQ